MNISRLNWEVFRTRKTTLKWCHKKNCYHLLFSASIAFSKFDDKNEYIAGRFRCKKKYLNHIIKTPPKKMYEFNQAAAKKHLFLQC